MITVDKFSEISGIGQRTNNEDHKGSFGNRIFVVCDGVGGSEKGEIASEIVVHAFLDAYKKKFDARVEEVLVNAEALLSGYSNEHPEASGMASTLTFSQIRDDGVLIAWCGDSRVYQFRSGKIIYRTNDHSWVNEALQAGIITPEEAVNHPRSRVITRAIQGSYKPEKADTVLLQDIAAGDIFLHCTDGVLEAWSDNDLEFLLRKSDDPVVIASTVNDKCGELSKDNFTAIVYRIQNARLSAPRKSVITHNILPRKRRQLYFLILAAIIILSSAALYIYKNYYKGNKKKPADKTMPVKKKIPAPKTTEK